MAPKVSVVAPHAMRSSAANLTAVAQHIEATGLDGLFVGDHLASRVPLLDSALVLATAAAATTRIAVGFGVMVLALRHPAWAAKQIATLQQLSGGRVILGVGAGGAAHGTAAWDALGIDFHARGARTDGALAVIRSLIAGETTMLDGEAELTLAPGVTPPPVWIGGHSSAAHNRTVAYGDGWFPSMITPEALAGGARRIAELCVQHGRADMPQIAAGASVLLGERIPHAVLDEHISELVDGYGIPAETASRLPLSGPPEHVAERMAAYVKAGAVHLVVGLLGADWREQCELLAHAREMI